MGELPPVGTRWGSLSAEQRRALPVGTVLRYAGYPGIDQHNLGGGLWRGVAGNRYAENEIDLRRTIYSYPEPTPCPDPS